MMLRSIPRCIRRGWRRYGKCDSLRLINPRRLHSLQVGVTFTEEWARFVAALFQKRRDLLQEMLSENHDQLEGRIAEPRKLFLAWQAPDHMGLRFRWAVAFLSLAMPAAHFDISAPVLSSKTTIRVGGNRRMSVPQNRARCVPRPIYA